MFAALCPGHHRRRQSHSTALAEVSLALFLAVALPLSPSLCLPVGVCSSCSWRWVARPKVPCLFGGDFRRQKKLADLMLVFSFAWSEIGGLPIPGHTAALLVCLPLYLCEVLLPAVVLVGLLHVFCRGCLRVVV